MFMIHNKLIVVMIHFWLFEISFKTWFCNCSSTFQDYVLLSIFFWRRISEKKPITFQKLFTCIHLESPSRLWTWQHHTALSYLFKSKNVKVRCLFGGLHILCACPPVFFSVYRFERCITLFFFFLKKTTFLTDGWFGAKVMKASWRCTRPCVDLIVI